jgi:hypothetical protein
MLRSANITFTKSKSAVKNFTLVNLFFASAASKSFVVKLPFDEMTIRDDPSVTNFAIWLSKKLFLKSLTYVNVSAFYQLFDKCKK